MKLGKAQFNKTRKVKKIKKGDEVLVTTGKDKGARGKILKVFPIEGKIIVEQVNVKKKHIKPSQGRPGSIINREFPIDASNVAIWNFYTNKPDKVAFKFLENGKKVRIFKSTQELIDREKK